MQKLYFRNLDGLRFFAFLSVFLFHSFYTPYDTIKSDWLYRIAHGLTRSGALGVNFFFVLSGFLITTLLFEEQKATGKINIGSFYMRRILRIWPLFYLMVFIGFVIYPFIRQWLGDHPTPETANLPLFLLFSSNFSNLYFGAQNPSLYILWSISIEEQFYLFWPWLVKYFNAAKSPWIFIGIILLSILSRIYYLQDQHQLYMNTLCVISDMAMGGLLAWAAFTKPSFFTHLLQLKKKHVVIAYVAGIILIASNAYWRQSLPLLALERVLFSCFFVFIIFDQTYLDTSFFKTGNYKLPTELGKITYGLYCYHYLGLLVAIKVNAILGINKYVLGVVLGDNILGLALSIVVALASYRYFEKPFLQLKHRFEKIQTK